MTRQQCAGFAVLPPSVFYEITYPSWRLLFDESLNNATLKKFECSFGVHVWNRMSNKEKISVRSKQAYGLLAQKHCPRVYSNCGPEFWVPPDLHCCHRHRTVQTISLIKAESKFTQHCSNCSSARSKVEGTFQRFPPGFAPSFSTDKQTNKQTNKHTNKHTNRQTYIHTNKQTHTDKQTDKHTNIHTNKQTNKYTYKQTNRQTNIQTNIQTNTKTDRQTNKHTNKQTGGQHQCPCHGSVGL